MPNSDFEGIHTACPHVWSRDLGAEDLEVKLDNYRQLYQRKILHLPYTANVTKVEVYHCMMHALLLEMIQRRLFENNCKPDHTRALGDRFPAFQEIRSDQLDAF